MHSQMNELVENHMLMLLENENEYLNDIETTNENNHTTSY